MLGSASFGVYSIKTLLFVVIGIKLPSLSLPLVNFLSLDLIYKTETLISVISK